MEIETRAALQRRLTDAGMAPADVERVAMLTIPLREEDRVQRTLEAARAGTDSDAEAAACLLADIIGVGGSRGAGILGRAAVRSLRTEAFRSLGLGRWNAGDGAAYHAAALVALSRLIPDSVEGRGAFAASLEQHCRDLVLLYRAKISLYDLVGDGPIQTMLAGDVYQAWRVGSAYNAALDGSGRDPLDVLRERARDDAYDGSAAAAYQLAEERELAS